MKRKRAPRPKPRESEAAKWTRERLGKQCFAPFTGQDWRAWAVWIHALELWFGSDHQGQEWALEALRCCLGASQPKCWPVFRAAIPAIGDWSHEEEIWRLLQLVQPRPHMTALCPDCVSEPEPEISDGAK